MSEPSLPLQADPAIGWPVVYINLDEHEARRQALQAQLQAFGIVATRLPAVRWTKLPPQEQQRLYSEGLNRTQYHTPLVAGERGCYASHLRACEALLASPHAALVVLEDDVVLTPRFVPALRDLRPALEASNPPWHLVKLIGRTHEKLRHRQALNEDTELVAYARVPSLTAGHVITREGARRLLQSRVPFGRPIDLDLRRWWENGLCIRGLHPAVIALSEHSNTSSIGTKGDESRLAVKWHKFRIKFTYSLLNAWHGRRHPDR